MAHRLQQQTLATKECGCIRKKKMVTVKYRMNKKSDANKIDPDMPPFIHALKEKIVANLDIDALSESLATKLSERLVSSLQIDCVVDQIFDKYGDHLQKSLTEAIIARL